MLDYDEEVDLEFGEDDNPRYENQSYITEEMQRGVPDIPPVSHGISRGDSNSAGAEATESPSSQPLASIPEMVEEESTSSHPSTAPDSAIPGTMEDDEIPSMPTDAPPLPPVFDLGEDDDVDNNSESLANQSIDQIIGLAPEKELSSTQVLLQKVQTSMDNVKERTTQVINRMFRRSSTESTDLLGIAQEDVSTPKSPVNGGDNDNDMRKSVRGEEQATDDGASSAPSSSSISVPPSTSAAFDAQPEYNHVQSTDAAPASNDDVAELFGVVSFDDETGEDSDSDPEDCQERSGKQVFDAKSVEVYLQVLRMSKQITPGEALVLEGAAQEDRKNVERILRSYMEEYDDQ